MSDKMDKNKLIKMFVTLAAIVLLAGGILRMIQGNSLSLAENEARNGGSTESSTETDEDESKDEAENDPEQEGENETPSQTENLQTPEPLSVLTGATLNGSSRAEDRITYTEGFYYEPVSDNLRRYMTGISYPLAQTPKDAVAAGTVPADSNKEEAPAVTWEELRYVHIWHYDFDGNPAEGELICNEYIAQDLVEIFYELYRNEYRLERVLLIDEYDGDDIASMEDNNTSCFNYRVVAGSSSLSNHAYGLAVDVNPLYNPYVTYGKDGTMNVSPGSGESYADRSLSFPYKIDEEDLCYKLFIRHGFTWGGSWNHSKDYQHFQKTKP